MDWSVIMITDVHTLPRVEMTNDILIIKCEQRDYNVRVERSEDMPKNVVKCLPTIYMYMKEP